MSASLVGSEMCIRDRLLPVLVARVVGGSVVAPVAAVVVDDCVCLSALGSVSYTHLTLPTICSV
eukprot:3895755-Alexandrium_andersonii.AAC.1